MDTSFLKASREKADLTQEEIAPLLQMSRSTVSKLENGERVLKVEDLLRWLQVVQQQLNKVTPNSTTPIEAGITLINGVDIVALTDMLTTLVGGFINLFC